MSYNIEPRKVAGVVIEANASLQGKGFNHGEVVIGLSELIGRIIVDAIDSPLQAEDFMKVIDQHIRKTISIGSQSQGKKLILEA